MSENKYMQESVDENIQQLEATETKEASKWMSRGSFLDRYKEDGGVWDRKNKKPGFSIARKEDNGHTRYGLILFNSYRKTDYHPKMKIYWMRKTKEEIEKEDS